MLYEYQVEFAAMKGLGPDVIVVSIPVAFDDIPPDEPEPIVRDWAINDARAEMRRRGYTRFTLRDVLAA